jgi:hypothetical protein
LRVIVHVFFSTFTTTYVYACSFVFIYSIVVVVATAAAAVAFFVVGVFFYSSPHASLLFRLHFVVPHLPSFAPPPLPLLRDTTTTTTGSHVTTAIVTRVRAKQNVSGWIRLLLQVDDTEQVSADLG